MATRKNTPLTLKRCAHCELELEHSQFSKNRCTKDGLFSYCKACNSKVTAKIRERRKASWSESTAPKSKWCPQCLKVKPASAFYMERTASSGLTSACKACTFDKRKEYYKKNRTTLIRLGRYRRGMTENLAQSILESQGNACGICRKPLLTPRQWTIDHDHKTGTNRGLLCYSCNSGLGQFSDCEDTLKAAIKYLRKYKKLSPKHREV